MENSKGIVSRLERGPRHAVYRDERPSLVGTSLDVVMDDGGTKTFRAWRSRYDVDGASALGAVRLVPGVTAAQADQWAFATMMQAAALRLPYGGACGCIDADTRRLSARELGRLAQSYVARFPDFAVTQPNGWTGGTVLSGWRCRNQRTLRFGSEPSGHPPLCWEEAVGLGAFSLINQACPNPGTWVLLGCDQLAFHLARLLTAAGWKLRAASDGRTTVRNSLGLTPSELAFAMARDDGLAAVVGDRGTSQTHNLFDDEVDLVVVAASERLTEAMASHVRCRVVAELAVDGVGSAIDTVLARREITSIPEIAATAGGAIFGHLARLRRQHGREWNRREMTVRLMTRMNDLRSLPARSMRGEALARAAGFMRMAGGGVLHAL